MSETRQHIYRPSTSGVVRAKVIFSLLPIAQIAVGASYHNDCPKQHYIPIYLEVMGGILLLQVGLSSLRCVFNLRPSGLAFGSVNILLLLCWFITGNVWIYSIYEPNYNQTITDVDPYCNKTLYLFAFWTTNVTYIQMILICCICCCCPRHLPEEMEVPL